MSKITVGNLKEIGKSIAEVVESKWNGFEIEIKQYISTLDKIKIISGICKSGISIDDGFYNINYVAIGIAHDIKLLEEYTNIKLPKDSMLAYDLIHKTGIYNFVIESIDKNELDEFAKLFKQQLKTKENEQAQQNGALSVIKDILLNFSNTIPNIEDINNLLKTTVKDVNSLDKDNLTYINDFMKVNSGGVVNGEGDNI